jgi:hypothetical protein
MNKKSALIARLLVTITTLCSSLASAEVLSLASGERLALAAGETLSSGLEVATGATLAGEGTVTGAASVSGLVDPGSSPDAAGTLTLAGGVTFTSEATLRMHVFADGTADQLAGSGEVFVLGGTFKAVVPAGYTAATRVFTVLTHTLAFGGAFSNIAGSSVPACLADDSLAGLSLAVSILPGFSMTLSDAFAESELSGTVYSIR